MGQKNAPEVSTPDDMVLMSIHTQQAHLEVCFWATADFSTAAGGGAAGGGKGATTTGCGAAGGGKGSTTTGCGAAAGAT